MTEQNMETDEMPQGQLDFNALPPEMKVNVIITDMLGTIDRLIDMRFALNQILQENPHLGQMQPPNMEGHETADEDHGCGNPSCDDPSCEEESE